MQWFILSAEGLNQWSSIDWFVCDENLLDSQQVHNDSTTRNPLLALTWQTGLC